MEDPRSRLRALGEDIAAQSQSPGFGGCAFIKVASEFDDPDEPVRRAVTAHRAWFAEIVRTPSPTRATCVPTIRRGTSSCSATAPWSPATSTGPSRPPRPSREASTDCCATSTQLGSTGGGGGVRDRRRIEMGKLIATTQATLDGVVDPVGEWVQPDGDHGDYSFERQARSSGLVLGRKTYEGLAGYWPSQSGKWAGRVKRRRSTSVEHPVRRSRVERHPARGGPRGLDPEAEGRGRR